MTVAEPFKIVLDLASENVIDLRDNGDEHTCQTEAIATLEDFEVNQLGDH